MRWHKRSRIFRVGPEQVQSFVVLFNQPECAATVSSHSTAFCPRMFKTHLSELRRLRVFEVLRDVDISPDHQVCRRLMWRRSPIPLRKTIRIEVDSDS